MAFINDVDNLSQPFMNATLVQQFKDVLQFVQSNHYPHIPNPSACQKRASVYVLSNPLCYWKGSYVNLQERYNGYPRAEMLTLALYYSALIVRFRPSKAHSSSFDPTQCGAIAGSSQQRVENFFSQPWVQEGEPEILFIKRAARAGDRWTSHIAFPGGGREPLDEDDCAASVRETREEVGLDLNADHCTQIGNLPEQVVTTWWSKVPYEMHHAGRIDVLLTLVTSLMVLCPYVHLVMRYDLPPLTLQPTEVKSAHWVSLRALMSPHLRTLEPQDVSERFFRQASLPVRRILRAVVGQLLFAARELVPTESIHSRTLSDYRPTERPSENLIQVVTSRLYRALQVSQPVASGRDPPLILWGLTHGILANLLDLMPTENPTLMSDWPTLSPWDIRFTVWAYTYRFRRQQMKVFTQRKEAAGQAIKSVAEVYSLDNQTFTASNILPINRLASQDIVGEMLDGYFDRLRIAIWIALFFRVGLGTLMSALILQRWHRSRLSRF